MRAVAFPDSEHIAVRWLTADATLTAPATTNLTGWRAGQRRIIVTRIGGVPQIPYRVDVPRLDVDVYADKKETAHDLAQAARARLHELPNGDHTDLGAVVCDVRDEGGLQWLPDPDTNAPRYLFTVALVVCTNQ